MVIATWEIVACVVVAVVILGGMVCVSLALNDLF
jgi:hypothetical protein